MAAEAHVDWRMAKAVAAEKCILMEGMNVD